MLRNPGPAASTLPTKSACGMCRAIACATSTGLRPRAWRAAAPQGWRNHQAPALRCAGRVSSPAGRSPKGRQRPARRGSHRGSGGRVEGEAGPQAALLGGTTRRGLKFRAIVAYLGEFGRGKLAHVARGVKLTHHKVHREHREIQFWQRKAVCALWSRWW